MENKKIFSVYALTLKGVAIYVGCTGDIKNRLVYHKKDKVFDSHVIIDSFQNKQDALLCERSIIKFITLFSKGEFYNSEYINLSYKRDTQLRYE